MVTLGNTAVVFFAFSVFVVYTIYKRMAKAGSPLFKIGYALYTKTRIGQFYYRRELAKARQKYNSAGHSIVTPTTYNGLKIQPVAMSEDNYAYIIVDEISKQFVLVDPADSSTVLPLIAEQEGNLVAILTTHKHWDHSGGNSDICKRFRNLQVYGGALDGVPGVTHPVADGDRLSFGQLEFTVIFTPGHTVGHCVYVLNGQPFEAPDCLFSGDLLFLGGCGRMFEGPPSTMLQSLDKLGQLKPSTLVWPGHEYASDNLKFATSLEPDNEKLQEKLKWVLSKRTNRECTAPSTMGEEWSYNPFLRTREQTIREVLGIGQDLEAEEDMIRSNALAEIRQRKDKFKYKL